MAAIGIIVPANGNRFPIDIRNIVMNSLVVTADETRDGVEITIKIAVPGGRMTNTKNPSQTEFFFGFERDNIIKSAFDPAVNKAQVLRATTASFVNFELDLDLDGKVGGANT